MPLIKLKNSLQSLEQQILVKNDLNRDKKGYDLKKTEMHKN